MRSPAEKSMHTGFETKRVPSVSYSHASINAK